MPRVSLKLPKVSAPKIATMSIQGPKIPASPSIKPFNFSAFSKVPKIPKAPKMKILKSAIKKVTNKGF